MDFGLSQIVTEPTRNSNILDVFLTSRPDLFDCRVAKSVLKSDHLAVYINCDQSRGRHPGAKRQIKCYNTSATDIARLNKFLVITIGMQLLAELIMELCLLTRRLLIL